MPAPAVGPNPAGANASTVRCRFGADQIIVRMLSAVENGYLCSQKVEKSGEVDMLGLPYGQWLGHGVLLREWFWATRPQAVPKRKWVRPGIPWKAMVFQTTQEPC